MHFLASLTFLAPLLQNSRYQKTFNRIEQKASAINYFFSNAFNFSRWSENNLRLLKTF
ncbi:hypothetical protein GGD38_003523 [Chitinophagaceae bacterium OAS944]|nr:hypothetical protein [Chitinophagaceae bacterium OAS944]